MAVDGRKRSLPPKVVAMKARKRQKFDSLNGQGTNKAQSRKQAVNLNSLAWKKVSMPDRLDDYEGFFGLEEIDDVEIVKDEANGKLSYHVKSESAPAVLDEFLATAKDEGNPPEWSGFDDDVAELPARKSIDTSGSKGKSKGGSLPKAEAKTKQVAVTRLDSGQVNGAFASLAEQGEDEGVDVSAWQELRLSPDTLASLSRLKFATPTAIQKAVIPEVLAGHDVIGKASTGSGKTLAFGVPILERFLETRTQHGERNGSAAPLALILSPTRELAHQLDKHIGALCSGMLFASPVIATLTGGLSVQKQQRLLKEADVIIGTPGRLWEVISQGQGIGATLKQIQFLVVDEADRLLSDGHFKEVEDILNALDRVDRDETELTDAAIDDPAPAESSHNRQTLVFSATFDRGLQTKLVGKGHRRDNLLSNKESLEYLLGKLNFREEDPKFIDVNPVNQLATGLKEGLIECGATEKDLYLYALLLLHPNLRTLVFTNSISAVRRITPLLQNLSLPVLALHSGMPQKARLRSVERFSQDKSTTTSTSSSSVLIATDVAARGLDISNVQLVIHYHLPRAADMYVHRSGRTARAGQKGASILICAPEEVAGVRKLVAQVHARSLAQDPTAKKGGGGSGGGSSKSSYFIRTLDIDRRVVSRLKARVSLAKTLADAVRAREKSHREHDFLREAAEDLGVEYDSEDEDGGRGGKRGRGGGRKAKEREARALSKTDAAALRAELRDLLRQRVNVGVSERYLTSGRVDVDELLRQQDAGVGKTGEFLGAVGDLGLEE